MTLPPPFKIRLFKDIFGETIYIAINLQNHITSALNGPQIGQENREVTAKLARLLFHAEGK